MSSLKMTFSLASLFLILGLVFVATPAMAQSINFNAHATSAPGTTPSGRTINQILTFNTDSGETIPAGGYLIIHRGSGTDATAPATFNGLPSFTSGGPVKTLHWSEMPDLEALFFVEGGTILLQAPVTQLDADGTLIPTGTFGVGLRPKENNFTEFRYDHDGDDDGTAVGLPAHASAVANDGKKDDKAPAEADAATVVRDINDGDLSITEVMWGLNKAQAGTANDANHQWIEIHNRNANVPLPLKGVRLQITSGFPELGFDIPAVTTANNEAHGLIGVDRIESVNALGKAWHPKGASGSDDGADGAAEETFVSMYRNRGKLGKDEGSNIGHWTASSQVYRANHQGTPGAVERSGVVAFDKKGFTLGDVLINEVGSRNSDNDNGNYEWIELKGPAGKVLENWQVSVLTAKDTEVELFTLPKKGIPANGHLLVVDTDPSNNASHPLAAGWNLEKDADGQVEGVASQADAADRRHVAQYIVRDFKNGGLPDGDFVLVLRSGNDKRGKNEKIVDIAGYENGGLKVPDTQKGYTNLWPLTGAVQGADFNNNNLVDETVHRRQHAGVWGTSSVRAGHGDANNVDKAAMRDVGWTGIGYKRNAQPIAAHGGTPGYPNDALKSEGADAEAAVQISEIMYTKGDRNLTQWIELRNTSEVHGANLGLWRLYIVNHHETMDEDGMMVDYKASKLSDQIDLSGTIPPGQTYLIVGRSTGRNTTKLPAGRVKSANRKRSEMLFNPYGFQLTLKTKRDKGAGDQKTVDEAGNLMPKPANSRRTDAQSFHDEVAWNWPVAVNEDGDRISVVRVPKTKSGLNEGGWALYNTTAEYENISEDTYYGHETDVCSPGHHYGGILPVSLSKFRPERMKDTGQVVIRWVTESELNNAGFNILRSETKAGEFTRINKELIEGKGTTSERNSYTYTDTSAKPNVVYYYQIQDVSFDGEVTTLRTTHLRGNVTAAGKLTTTWGELKALQ